MGALLWQHNQIFFHITRKFFFVGVDNFLYRAIQKRKIVNRQHFIAFFIHTFFFFSNCGEKVVVFEFHKRNRQRLGCLSVFVVLKVTRNAFLVANATVLHFVIKIHIFVQSRKRKRHLHKFSVWENDVRTNPVASVLFLDEVRSHVVFIEKFLLALLFKDCICSFDLLSLKVQKQPLAIKNFFIVFEQNHLIQKIIRTSCAVKSFDLRALATRIKIVFLVQKQIPIHCKFNDKTFLLVYVHHRRGYAHNIATSRAGKVKERSVKYFVLQFLVFG